jgi:hypothetical protein
MGAIALNLHKCLKFPFENDIYTMHHSGFNPISSHGKFSLDYFWPKPMEPIKPCEDFFLLSYQHFKEKFIMRISIQNMAASPILDETMIEPKDVSKGKHKTKNQDKSSSHKIPRDNQVSLAMPPTVKKFYKEKEKVVEKPPMSSFILLS